ncbi:MAG: Uma2 family endonuclease [Bacteroidetes bacterium]|nr:MAG: Uma2 family endonuclease [Bacteroidota bacterium]
MSQPEVINNPIREWMEFAPITLNKPMSREEFIQLSSKFPDLQMELEESGKTIIMTPVKKGSGKNELTVSGYLFIWYLKNKSGEVFSPSTGIELPDGSIRCPDCAWVSDERLAILPESSDEDFLKAVPDFVVEIRSQSDDLDRLQKKMSDTWMGNGVRLAWLIDPYEEVVHIYRVGEEVQLLKGFQGQVLKGEEVMPGMELPLDDLRRK